MAKYGQARRVRAGEDLTVTSVAQGATAAETHPPGTFLRHCGSNGWA